MNSRAFLEALHGRVQALHTTVSTDFAPLEAALLNVKPSPTSWSILECLEHLNRYARYYLPQLAKALAQPAGPAPTDFSHSWLGRKSIEAVRPENQKKQKTLARMNPNQSQLSPATIAEFLAHQQQLLALLAQAKTTDLSRKAIPVEFFRLLKLSIGDALEFVVAHQERHVLQAERVRQQLHLELRV
ncbi:DinB superfamily protein [Hymenobacter daecheongensis DSM 21074]|uniref:DinB superfamily protein n=1 Tax=Hymenobacter daecheongensis DSM 21074 TaxID=1121955 RepID=A0A1M6ILA9_9BACT|nr:DinB family protein [Hymenobacter daecheongensis]SHJ35210.1 DinB superfamily protein [Hymenobacter daecheongensis DSM 21074]